MRITHGFEKWKRRQIRIVRFTRSLFSLYYLSLVASLILAADHDRIIHVVDGDTFVLQRIGKVRLIGVDAPELVHPQRSVEHFAREECPRPEPKRQMR